MVILLGKKFPVRRQLRSLNLGFPTLLSYARESINPTSTNAKVTLQRISTNMIYVREHRSTNRHTTLTTTLSHSEKKYSKPQTYQLDLPPSNTPILPALVFASKNNPSTSSTSSSSTLPSRPFIPATDPLFDDNLRMQRKVVLVTTRILLLGY